MIALDANTGVAKLTGVVSSGILLQRRGIQGHSTANLWFHPTPTIRVRNRLNHFVSERGTVVGIRHHNRSGTVETAYQFRAKAFVGAAMKKARRIRRQAELKTESPLSYLP